MATANSGPPSPPPPPSVLDTLGEEIVRIVAPVSACMLLVVLLTAALSPSSSGPSSILTDVVSDSTDSTSSWVEQLGAALLNSLRFVVLITALTFLLLLLFYLRCTAFLRYYMAFSSTLVLALMGGGFFVLLLRRLDVPLDCFTFLVLLFNFAIVGAVAVLGAVPIALTQGYLVLIAVLVAYWFTVLPEWTTWALLVSMALYDLAAVLLPVGPLRLLVELAVSRDEEIPALVYEARPVVEHHEVAPAAPPRRRQWTEVREFSPNAVSNFNASARAPESQEEEQARLVTVEEGRDGEPLASALSVPLLEQPLQRAREEDDDGIRLGTWGAIKLGLGDFIFYSVLVGRAAMYDFTAAYACYLAIIAGLGITLLLLTVYRQALPALPVSIALGLIFYLLTRLLLEVFVVQCSLNLLMF